MECTSFAEQFPFGELYLGMTFGLLDQNSLPALHAKGPDQQV